MTQNLIETVAEAAFVATREAPWSDVDPLVKPLLLIEAKAAILATLDAIREPAKKLLDATIPAMKEVNDILAFAQLNGQWVSWPIDAAPPETPMGKSWIAMIDALRAEIESAA
jgi:hypothetical protein